MSVKFFTNKHPNSLLNKFNAVFENNPQIQVFHCVSGYFRASGYYYIREKLRTLQEVKILVGIDVDKIDDFYRKKNEKRSSDGERINKEYVQEVLEDVFKKK